MTSSPMVRPPARSIMPAIPHMLLRLYPIRFWQNIGFLCLDRNLESGNASERMGPRGHMTLMGDSSYKSNASNKYHPFVTIREAVKLHGSDRVRLASEAALHGLRFARGFVA